MSVDEITRREAEIVQLTHNTASGPRTRAVFVLDRDLDVFG